MNAALPMSPALERKVRKLDDALLDRFDQHALTVLSHCTALEQGVRCGAIKDTLDAGHVVQALSEVRSLRETIALARQVL